MKPLFTVIVAAALAAAVALPAQAQWKWRDKSGRVTVSDMPPPRGTPDADILQRPSDALRNRPAPAAAAAVPAASTAAAQAARVDPELEARRKKAEQEQDATRKKDEERQAAARAENCRIAQQQLRSMESGMRIARVNEKGEREILDDKQIAAELQRARNVAASDCKN